MFLRHTKAQIRSGCRSRWLEGRPAPNRPVGLVHCGPWALVLGHGGWGWDLFSDVWAWRWEQHQHNHHKQQHQEHQPDNQHHPLAKPAPATNHHPATPPCFYNVSRAPVGGYLAEIQPTKRSRLVVTALQPSPPKLFIWSKALALNSVCALVVTNREPVFL